ncbi:hypothetical protein A6A40_17320 (plasmid) [Azospirillum humicireducens]|uniref:DUF3168 domain-containing protein n=1 Tax=Azospirillum humicireducens TaxID=1226968 RepID=A0A2R4VQW9_9PROT|nr:hypothetical protein [Azospirillum humicireducens]AWB06812.1 hypothetical protein A6A40_17320 [Azospirillum humicireducens]
MTTPIDLVAAVQARLRDKIPEATLPDIKGETDFARLIAEKRLPARMPAAFVVAPGWNANYQRRVGAVSHDITQGVAVVLVQSHAGDASGALARASVWPLELAVVTALAGWSPAEGYLAFAATESRLQGLGSAGAAGAVASTLSFVTEWKLHAKEARP